LFVAAFAAWERTIAMVLKRSLGVATLLLALSPLQSGIAGQLDQRLIGAWATSASDCKDVFESKNGKVDFRQPVNSFTSAFIVGEREVRGVSQSCRIEGASPMKGYLRIKLECHNSIGFLPTDARVKIMSDSQISYGDVASDPTVDATYVRCVP
jgi:hypothetical protein